MGGLVAKVLEGEGLAVRTGTLARTDPSVLKSCDLIVIGSPVHYMDLPVNVAGWLERAPDISGKPVASFLTYGGAGSNQVDTGWKIAGLLKTKGGAPVGMEVFGNMSTYAPSFISESGRKRILKYRHLPDERTFENGRRFARDILGRTRNGKTVEIGGEFSFSGLVVPLKPAWWMKKLIDSHRIDRGKCIGCGICAGTCPVGAIGPEKASVDRKACLLCMGCLNNCPADAVEMTYQGERLPGFRKFCRDNGIVIAEPRELAVDKGA
jgi:ferredoxin